MSDAGRETNSGLDRPSFVQWRGNRCFGFFAMSVLLASMAQAQEPAKRPALLLPLEATFVGLQVLDVQSTLSAVDHGKHEANPILQPFVTAPAGLIAVKAVGTTAILIACEQLRKQHPKAAVLLLIGVNLSYGFIVRQNSSAQ